MARISLLLLSLCLLVAGCVSEPYQNNVRLNMLYRFLNNETSRKERVLFFEMEDYSELLSEEEFYITGVGISVPGAYPCSGEETLLSAIEKAGQVSSFDQLSYTLIKGIRSTEREISGLVLSMGSPEVPGIQPGDLILLKSLPERVGLSQK